MSCRFAAVVMSHSQTDWFLHVPRDLTHAWLSPWNQHTTAGRINQVFSPSVSGKRKRGPPHRNPLALSLPARNSAGTPQESPVLFCNAPELKTRMHSSDRRFCPGPLCCSRFTCPLHIVPKHINESEEAQRTPVDTKPEATVRRSQHRTIAARLRGNTVPRCSHDSGFTLEEVFPDGGKDGRPGSLASPPDSTRDHLHL